MLNIKEILSLSINENYILLYYECSKHKHWAITGILNSHTDIISIYFYELKELEVMLYEQSDMNYYICIFY